jgi:hypothetical protein
LPVCFWEDDGQDDHDADLVRGGPNGALSDRFRTWHHHGRKRIKCATRQHGAAGNGRACKRVLDRVIWQRMIDAFAKYFRESFRP